MSIVDKHENGKYRESVALYAQRMVEEQIRSRGVRDEAVLAAMGAVPRHRFVPGAAPSEAYSDNALPTRQGQTISQPYIVALMTELLQVGAGDKVLEVGTGSGYQAAVLAEMGVQVISIERYEELAAQARSALDAMGYGDLVTVVTGDGTLGRPEDGPYDGIIVTAGAPNVPQTLAKQLRDGARLVVPIGDQLEQRMMVVVRDGDEFQRWPGIACRFVPLVGAEGWKG